MLMKLKEKLKQESGNTLILFLIFIPFMLGMFGIAVDTIIWINAKSSMQAALDSASVVYASQKHDIRYQNLYIDTYKSNIAPSKGFLKCTSDPCGSTPVAIPDPANPNTTFILSVEEKVNFVFLDSSGLINLIAPNAQESIDKLSQIKATSTATIK